MMSLKKIRSYFILLLILVGFPSYAQKNPYGGFASEYYFGRQLSTRAEAMGQSFTSVEGDASSIHFNPSGIGNLDGIEVSITYATPYYILEDANNLAINLASRISKKVAVGYSYNTFNYGLKNYITDDFGTILDSSDNKITNHKIAVAFRAEPTFFIGGSIGFLNFDYGNYNGQALQLDFGVNKKFEFTRFKNNQSINLATTFKNPIGTEMTLESANSTISTGKATLPLIMQSGLSYYYTSESKYNGIHVFKLIASVDYQTLFNSRNYFNKYSTGLELSFLEVLHLRGGYYRQSISNFGSSKNKSELQDLTYGIGFSVPVHKLTNAPIQLNFDYCSMPQPSALENANWESLNSFTGSLKYILF